jgi:hypothetical protein
METAARLSPAQRDRALKRIRSITAGATIAATAAFGAFGFMAFSTNPGSQVDAGSVTDDGSNNTDPGYGDGSGGAPNAGDSNSSGSNSGGSFFGSNGSNGSSSQSNGSNGSSNGSVTSGSQNNGSSLFRNGVVSRSHARRAHVVTGGS